MKIQPTNPINPPLQQLKTPETRAPAPAATPVAVTQPRGDTIELSVPAQVRQMALNGQNVSEIAYALGLTVQTVNDYLNRTQA